jgi:hypothetical protein
MQRPYLLQQLVKAQDWIESETGRRPSNITIATNQIEVRGAFDESGNKFWDAYITYIPLVFPDSRSLEDMFFNLGGDSLLYTDYYGGKRGWDFMQLLISDDGLNGVRTQPHRFRKSMFFTPDYQSSVNTLSIILEAANVKYDIKDNSQLRTDGTDKSLTPSELVNIYYQLAQHNANGLFISEGSDYGKPCVRIAKNERRRCIRFENYERHLDYTTQYLNDLLNCFNESTIWTVKDTVKASLA